MNPNYFKPYACPCCKGDLSDVTKQFASRLNDINRSVVTICIHCAVPVSINLTEGIIYITGISVLRSMSPFTIGDLEQQQLEIIQRLSHG